MQRPNWRKAGREGSIHSHEGEERYRDEPEHPDECIDEENDSVVSVSTSRKTAKQNIAPLFKTPPPEEEDPAVLV